LSLNIVNYLLVTYILSNTTRTSIVSAIRYAPCATPYEHVRDVT